MESPWPNRANRQRTHSISQLPPWYRRLRAIAIKEDREIELWEFDEDLSEWDDDYPTDYDEPNAEAECECTDEHECQCQIPDSNDDAGSERSYDGSDADYYYELKAEREQRKSEVWGRQKHWRADDERKEKQACAAYESMWQETQNGGEPWKVPQCLAGKIYRLQSVQHVDYCYNLEHYILKSVQFHKVKGDGETPTPDMEVTGRIDLNDSACDLLPFRMPQEAECKRHWMKTGNPDHKVSLQFIGDKYLFMTLNQSVLERDIQDSKKSIAPDVFEFVGFCLDQDEKRHRKRRKVDKRKEEEERVVARFWAWVRASQRDSSVESTGMQ